MSVGFGVWLFQLENWSWITNNSYDVCELRDMELLILEALQFDLMHMTPIDYLQGMLESARCDFAVAALARMLADVALFSYEATRHTASAVAAACVCVAMEYFGQVALIIPGSTWSTHQS